MGTRLFRQGVVANRIALSGVALFMPIGYYASASSLDSLDLAKIHVPYGYTSNLM